MGNIASSTGGHWDLSKPQPQWKPKAASKPKAAPKKSLWLPRQQSTGSDSNDDDWFIFKAPKSPPKKSPKKSTKPRSPRRR